MCVSTRQEDVFSLAMLVLILINELRAVIILANIEKSTQAID